MGVIKAMAPVVLVPLVAMLIAGMAGTSRPAGCDMSREVQERADQVRYLILRIAPLSAAMLFWASKADDDLGITGWNLRVLFVIGLALSLISTLLALAAIAVEFLCGVRHWPLAVVALVAVQAVVSWAVNRRLRALKLRRELALVK